MRKVIIVFGSPRKNSNTHILVTEAQRGLTEQGIASEIFYLNDLQIKGCQACYYCKKNHTTDCILQDDMQAIYQALKAADGLIVATPIYFGNVTAQTKLWLDRLFPYIDMNLRPGMPVGKKVGFIFTQNQPEPTLFSAPLAAFKSMLGLFGFDVKGSVLAYDVDQDYKPMVTTHREFMQQAHNLGRQLLA